MNGIININKPIGITSHDVVYRLGSFANVYRKGDKDGGYAYRTR